MRKRMRFGGPITQPVVVAISRSPYGADRSELHPLLSRINASVMWWIARNTNGCAQFGRRRPAGNASPANIPGSSPTGRTGQVRAVALGTSGMSDPNAGRYLEAWLPSNLIWDRFPVRLDIQITATLAAHSIHQRSCHRSRCQPMVGAVPGALRTAVTPAAYEYMPPLSERCRMLNLDGL
jgi:hypothetical protein